MERISNFKLETVEESQWIRIKQVNYKQKGIQKKQEITYSHDSCGILIHNKSRDVFVFVRQFRPAVFMHEVGWDTLTLSAKKSINPSREQLKKGFTFELCAGLLDKPGKSVAEVAAEEVLEECGYKVEVDQLEMVLSTRNNAFHSGTLQHLFYVQVTDAMKMEGWGGGNAEEGEFIEVLEIGVHDLLKSVFEDDIPKPIGLTFALLWFLFMKTPLSSNLTLSSGKHLPPGNDSSVLGGRLSDKRKRSSKTSTSSKKIRSNDFGKLDFSKNDGEGSEVTDVFVTDVRMGKQLHVYRLNFKQNDFQRSWDFLYVRSLCATLVHNTSQNVFLLVRKFSPAVYGSLQQTSDDKIVNPSDAYLFQLCYSSFEKGVEPCCAASDSVLDTFGYKVPSDDFEKILRSRSNVGIAGSIINLFYVKVTDEMKVSATDAKKSSKTPKVEESDYEIMALPVSWEEDDDVDGLEMLMMQGKNPMSLSFALLWYYYKRNISPHNL